MSRSYRLNTPFDWPMTNIALFAEDAPTLEETAHETILLPPWSENLDFLSSRNLPVDASRSSSENSAESA